MAFSVVKISLVKPKYLWPVTKVTLARRERMTACVGGLSWGLSHGF